MHIEQSSTRVSGRIFIALAGLVVGLSGACDGSGQAGVGGNGGSQPTGGNGGEGGEAPVGEPDPKAACKQLMACLNQVDIETAAALLDTYGDSGTCWTKTETDQATCGAFCQAELEEHHTAHPVELACARCADDTGCLDPAAPRCWHAGEVDAECGICGVAAHCSDPAKPACVQGGCWKADCTDHTLAQQLYAHLCEMCQFTPLECDTPGFHEAQEAESHKRGCHPEYVAYAECVLNTPGIEGCDPGFSCLDFLIPLDQCVSNGKMNGVQECP